ncbi:MAG TPA: hypothetical protein VNR70_16900 [Steroidobacteraceae bacterium]|nr:hypothetical protein [Steroidobacteraceae bacterium]
MHLGSGLPAFFMVGLPEAVVRESRERVRRVLKFARTCADLAVEPNIRRTDVSEAVRLRALDRLTC